MGVRGGYINLDEPYKPRRGRWRPFIIGLVLGTIQGFVAGFVVNFILTQRLGL